MSITLDEQQRNCLQEIANIAMGTAAVSIAEYLGRFVTLSIPVIRQIPREDVSSTIDSIVNPDYEELTATRQPFSGRLSNEMMAGEAIVLFSGVTIEELSKILFAEQVSEEDYDDLVLETSNIVNCACLNAIGDQLGIQFGYDAPDLVGVDIKVSDVFSSAHVDWRQLLILEIRYTMEDSVFKTHLFFMLPEDSISKLAHALDEYWQKLFS